MNNIELPNGSFCEAFVNQIKSLGWRMEIEKDDEAIIVSYWPSRQNWAPQVYVAWFFLTGELDDICSNLETEKFEFGEDTKQIDPKEDAINTTKLAVEKLINLFLDRQSSEI